MKINDVKLIATFFFFRIDLVQSQILVASGMTLPELGLTQDKIFPQVIFEIFYVTKFCFQFLSCGSTRRMKSIKGYWENCKGEEYL